MRSRSARRATSTARLVRLSQPVLRVVFEIGDSTVWTGRYIHLPNGFPRRRVYARHSSSGLPKVPRRNPSYAREMAIRRFKCSLTLAAATLAICAGPAQAIEAKVSITDSMFKPAVVTVAPGTDVVWTNDGTALHTIKSDDFPSSPALIPGQTHTQRFSRIGVYDYTDATNVNVTGTVIVAAAVRRPRRPRGGDQNKTHEYKGTFRLEVNESYNFFDGRWRSLTGACNAQIGDGSRKVIITANLKKADYTRIGAVESLESEKQQARASTYVERMTSKIADSSGPFTPLCQNGTTPNGPKAVHDANCSADRSGKRFKFDFRWVRSVARGRYAFGPSNFESPADWCGPNYASGLPLVGIEDDHLPLVIAGGHLLWDSGTTSSSTAGEVRQLRAGRPVTIKRELRLQYTADCCMGVDPRPIPTAGVYADTGLVIKMGATLTVKLRRR